MVSDQLDEWLLEIGFMNYAYGRGVSEWSLLIIPHKVAIVMVDRRADRRPISR